MHLPKPPPPRYDSEPLGKTAKLLEEAQTLLERASVDAAERHGELSRQIIALETNLQEMEQLLVGTERQAAQLANLYVATYQLHASLEVPDVRAAVADIAVNLLGAESFQIWVREDDGQLVRAPESSSDELFAPGQAYAGGDSLLDDALAHASPQFGPREGSCSLAAVPFAAHGQVVGALLIQRFLAHKQGMNAQDRELLDLMAAHAASALLAARAFHVTRRKLVAYEGLLGFLRGGTP